MNTTSLQKYEDTYIQACSLLFGDGLLRYEINHLHFDLQKSVPECRHLSDECLAQALTLKATTNFEKSKAVEILEKQVDHPPSAFLLGFIKELDTDYKEATALYMKSFDYAPSIIRIGVLYGINKIPETESLGSRLENGNKALELGQKALDIGYMHANNFLGALYYNAIGSTQDLPERERIIEANRKYEIAASQGCSCSLLNLGINTKSGVAPFDLLTEDERYEKAFNYFKLSADREDPGAFYRLGKMYREGRGPTKYLSTGRRLKEYFKNLAKAKEGRCKDVASHEISDLQYESMKAGGFFMQEIYDAIFYNLVRNDEDDNRYIEGEGFLLYCETGFNFDLIGTFCQGKLDKIRLNGEKPIVPLFEDIDNNTFEDIPEAYREIPLKFSQIELDFTSIFDNPNINGVIKCHLICPRE